MRDVTKATTGILLLAFACSGKKEQPPVVAVVADAGVDSSPPADASQPPFKVTRETQTFGSFVRVEQHHVQCPVLEWRPQPKTIRIGRCPERPFADQLDTLRDMLAYLRTLERIDDDLRIVGLGDYYSYPELARRFVTYAKTHPYKDNLHAWIKQAANSGDMMPELAVIFQRKPLLSSVEKCSTGRATGKNDLAQFVRNAGGTGSAEIPLGCAMTIFELAPP